MKGTTEPGFGEHMFDRSVQYRLATVLDEKSIPCEESFDPGTGLTEMTWQEPGHTYRLIFDDIGEVVRGEVSTKHRREHMYSWGETKRYGYCSETALYMFGHVSTRHQVPLTDRTPRRKIRRTVR